MIQNTWAFGAAEFNLSANLVDLAGSAAMSISASNQIGVTKTLGGSAAMQISSSGGLDVTKTLGGAANIAINAQADVSLQKFLSGLAEINVSSAGYLDQLFFKDFFPLGRRASIVPPDLAFVSVPVDLLRGSRTAYVQPDMAMVSVPADEGVEA